MDPVVVLFGFGIGVLVGLTGMGGASLMTPLLVLIFKTEPVTAIGTDIFYAAVTKTVGGYQHLRAGTVHKGLAFWMAVGSVPAAVAGVYVIEVLEKSYGEDRLKGIVFGLLGGTLVVVGMATMLRTVFLPDVIKERFAMHLHRRHIIAAIATGLVTGFIIGLTSAGSGTLIGIILIAVFRLTPNRVVGTDIFHAAVLLWAASAAHLVGGNIDFGLAGNILVGSIPGVLVGGKLAFKSGKNLLRGLLAAVLMASGTILITKGDAQLAVLAASVVALAFGVLFTYVLRREVKLPHGEGVQAYKLVKVPWAKVPADATNGDAPVREAPPEGSERERDALP
ncbi:MAG: sulfite exporter TauE/SafE family protein [Solirubrobacterales bacterium]|nr:sulfite exporter TauE/SafE family protein [Solirubrobacterales bacterium]MCB8971259.1 sulfite exporter TauE/SafE family protein [Thermoleophilales bacterium]MCO5325886.1 sulfite exporter TauE/SafE family protein [Solirubrobacterales bacterium]